MHLADLALPREVRNRPGQLHQTVVSAGDELLGVEEAVRRV